MGQLGSLHSQFARYYAKNVKTPLLMLHNDKDGAVDFTQGVEYFNTLRRLQKPVWLSSTTAKTTALRPAQNARTT